MKSFSFSDQCATPQIISDTTNNVYGVYTTIATDCVIAEITNPTVESPAPLNIDFSIAALDTQLIGMYFLGGLVIWSLGLGVGVVINVMRRAR